MKLLLELSMECESLARAEALAGAAALGATPRVLLEEPGVLVLDTDADPKALASRLGLCHHVSRWLCTCEKGQVEECAHGLSVEGPIRVRSTKIGQQAVDLAGTTRKVGAILRGAAGVDLNSPKSDVRVVFSHRAHIGARLASVDRPAFERRKNRYLPFTYPASVHPKFARALVNLTQVPRSGRLLDPFCGTGAIVIEAAAVGIEAVGSDLSERMIEGAGKNLSHLGLNAELHVCDVGDISSLVGRADGVATDPPYGRSTSTRGEDIARLYRRALLAFAEILPSGSRAAVVVPETGLLKAGPGFELDESYELRVHRSLTRHFCVLRRT